MAGNKSPAGMSSAEFIAVHLAENQPLVSRSWCRQWWPKPPPWDLGELARRFGDCRVPVFDSLFEMQRVVRFEEYISAMADGVADGEPVPYMRWYARQRNFQMICADDAFVELAGDWAAPSWLPSDDYVFPAIKKNADPTKDSFPAKGLFICAAGGRTRLHADPWASDACLCQITGEKRFVLYPPAAGKALCDDAGVVDLDRPDTARFPQWNSVEPALDVTLQPGDAIFIPAGWYHAAVTLSASVSVTWNFVHAVNADRFKEYLASGGSADPTVKYFQGQHRSEEYA